jgi:putative endonuclease
MTERASLGARGEQLAVAYLQQRGYSIRARNVRLPPWGEIDIVAERGGVLALVEVRLRRGARLGGPLESIGPAKRARMLNAAHAYLTSLGDDPPPARIDVVGITLDVAGRLLRIDHVEHAVEES